MPSDYTNRYGFPSSTLSVDDAKSLLLDGQETITPTDQATEQDVSMPAYTPEQAKEALLGSSLVSTKLQDKRALLSTVESRKDAIAQKVIEKQVALGKTSTSGPSLYGMPYAFLSEDNKAVANELYALGQQQEQDRIAEHIAHIAREDTAYVTDSGLDTLGGGIANVLLKFKSGVTTLGGQALQVPIITANAFNRSGLTKKDFEIYTSIRKKENMGVELSPEDLVFKEKEINTNYQGGKYETKSKYEKIADLQAGQLMLESVENTVTDYNSIANNKLTESALKEVKSAASKASKEIFEDGDILKGTWTALKGLGNLVGDNPQATVELAAEMLPTMFALATKATITAPILAASEYESAINEFTKEYQRPPDAVESAVAGLVVTGAVLLDVLGAKATIAGKKTLAGIVSSAEKLGIKVPTNTVDRAKTSIDKTNKTKLKKALGLSKPVAKVAGVAVIEGATEGAQSALTQYAGKQDVDKISTEDVIADTIVGAAIGGSIRAGVSGVEAAGKIKEATTKTKKVIKEKVQEKAEVIRKAGIGEVDEVVVQATKDKKPEVAITALQSVDLTTLTNEERVAQLRELQSQISQYETITENTKDSEEKKSRESQLADYKSALSKSVQTHLTLKSETNTVKDAVTILDSADTGSTTLVPADVKVVEDAVVTGVVSGTATIQQVNKVFGSTYFKEMSPDSQSTIQNYKELQDSTDKLRGLVKETREDTPTAESVNLDILTGGDGFVGIDQHIKNAQQAIAVNDISLFKDTVAGIEAFKQTQLDKLDPTHPSSTYTTPQGKQRQHSIKVRNFILEEISVLNAALKHINNIGSGLSEQTEVDAPTPVAEAAKPEADGVGIKSAVEATTVKEQVTPNVPAYDTLVKDPDTLSKLSKLSLPNDVDLTTNVRDAETVGDVLVRLDSRILGALDILKKCST